MSRTGHPSTPPRLGWARAAAALAAMSLLYSLLWLALLPIAGLAFGLEPQVITSGSMAPRIHAGDVVLTADPPPVDGDLLPAGTVVTFERTDGKRVTHRIAAVDPDARAYQTHGDANRRPDSDPVTPDQVVGVGRVLVPVAGTPLLWATTGRWLHLAGLALVVVAATWTAHHIAADERDADTRTRVGAGRGGAASVLVLLAAGLPSVVAPPSAAVYAATTADGSSQLAAATTFATGYWLHDDPTPPTAGTTAQLVLAADETAPTATTLYNYSTDLDAAPGRWLDRHGGPPPPGAVADNQVWALPDADRDVALAGTFTLELWARRDDSNGNRGFDLVADVYAYDPATSGWTLLASATTGGWQDTMTFTKFTLTTGTVSTTLPAGDHLRLHLYNTGTDEARLAYDTTSYPSRLVVPVPVRSVRCPGEYPPDPCGG